ncbi:MAG: UDP-2,3-diacylglucosamine diphosphatase, partial [Gammaproteobacteria bacterium]
MKPRFISDLHLSEKHPELTQAFFKFLNESKEACTHLFILGDLFETWIGDDDNSSLHSKIKTALKSFTTNGPETFFIHGNRDFLVGEVFAKETGVTILPDPYTLEINGQKVILSHGDFLCTDDKDYIEFRNQVRDQNWQNSFLKKSLNER